MKADFSRVTFDPLKQFSRVLMQQGRVQLDADFNEQVAIHLHLLRTFIADLIGRHGGLGNAFKITPGQDDRAVAIAPGHYYVNGILCDSPEAGRFQLPPSEQRRGERYLVYLDVWERDITWVEDGDIREVALGGPDTSSRAKVVWQVGARRVAQTGNIDIDKELAALLPLGTGRLAARALQPEKPEEPCTLPPQARYRGPENQLYRVEIHAGGETGGEKGPTFKWSRDNGTVVFPIREMRGKTVTVDHLGRDERFGLEIGDWVEVSDDGSVLAGEARPLYRVESIDPMERQVMLGEGPAPAVGSDPNQHPLLRRWDQKAAGREELQEGAVPVPSDVDNWIELEDGIQIRFQSRDAVFKTGDYWLIPARTATGDVEWPGEIDDPALRPPHGNEHHYAPLAIVTVPAQGAATVADKRFVFDSIARPAP